MQIIVYLENIWSIGGMQTWIKSFVQNMKPFYDIKLLYRTATRPALSQFEEIVECVKYNGQQIECDVCIYTTTLRKPLKVRANKFIQVIHADVMAWNPTYNPEGIDTHIAVSKMVKRSLKDGKNVKSVVIPNMIPEIDIKPVTRFSTFTRITQGKGLDRIVKLAKMMKEKGYKFTWEIWGGGSGEPRDYYNEIIRELKDVPEVNFMGVTDTPQSYMYKSDYTVQLSDNEGFCYSVYESLAIGVPVIVTDWEGVRDIVKDGENGYILNMDLNNIDLDLIFNEIPAPVALDIYEHNQGSIEKWIKLLDI